MEDGGETAAILKINKLSISVTVQPIAMKFVACDEY